MTIRAFTFPFNNAEWFGTCELCGKENEELRPFGPNNESICFDCGMKDQKTTEKKFRERGMRDIPADEASERLSRRENIVLIGSLEEVAAVLKSISRGK